jgi:hypothetical protein
MAYGAEFLALGSGLAFFAGENLTDLRERGFRGGFADSNEIVGASEIVPDERFHIGLDDDVGLLAPG